MVRKTLFTLTLLCSVSLVSLAREERPLWLRYPAISPDGTKVAFTYQGDLYTVPTSGGDAQRLTSGSAYECHPVWSPDGKQIAFTSDRNSSGTNIYIIPATGGEARQLTTHSGTEIPYAFTPDGAHVLFKAHIQDPAHSALFPTSILTEVYRVSVRGGARPELLLATPAEAISMSADGRRILYQDIKGFENEWRKHHTSSVARDLVEYDLDKKTYRYVLQHPAEDRNPLYAPDGKKLYFLSERGGGSMNVYEGDLSAGSTEAKALTHLKGDPIRFLSVSKGGLLAFCYAGELYTLTPGKEPQRISVRITKDRESDEQLHLSMSRSLGSSAVSPDGKQIAFLSRGDIFVTSADHSTTKQVTHGSFTGRGMTFGADNRTLVYASTKEGSWELYRARIGRSEDPNFPNATNIIEEKLSLGVKGEKMYPQFSPDGKELAFVLDRSKLMVYNLQTKQLRTITDGSQHHERSGGIDYTWSPDGHWFALQYVARAHAPYSDIGIVSAEGGKPVFNITNSGYFNTSPRWSQDGKALTYMTDRYGMRNHASWGSENDVMIVFLTRKGYERFRMTDEERELQDEAEKKAQAKAKADSTKNAKGKATKATPAKPEPIQLEGVEDRIVRLTPNSSSLADAILSPDGKKLYYFASHEGGYDLWVHDLLKNKTQLQKKLDLSSPFFDKDKEGKTLFILGSSPQKLDPKTDALKAITISGSRSIDRVKEREAMYEEVVREEAARFYRADMHGVDWAQLTKHYRQFLPHITTSQDFAEMLSELLGELNVSHTGGRYRASGSSFPTAELGLFLSSPSRGDGLRVDEVVVGGPFDVSWSRLRAGALITAIDGTPIKEGQDYFPLLNDKVGKRVLVTFRTAGGETIEEVIRPISQGTLSSLLYKRWIRQRASEVERLSGGQLGYVHIPSMGDPSFRNVYSDVLGKYYGKKGIVIDIRYNGGGRLHEDIEVFFSGKKYLQQVVRGKDYCEMPSRRWNHPSVMVTCEADYSNAHGSPWVYQHQGIGRVVGMPVPGTMTSVNWDTLLDPALYYGIPAVGYLTADGKYLENTEMIPDVVVPLEPGKVLQGHDTQLERAVEVLLSEVKK
jgi:hypothetical protein